MRLRRLNHLILTAILIGLIVFLGYSWFKEYLTTLLLSFYISQQDGDFVSGELKRYAPVVPRLVILDIKTKLGIKNNKKAK